MKKRLNKTNREKKFKALNGNWFAIILKNLKTGESEIIRDTDGQILADKNLINVQARVEELFPGIGVKNKRGALIKYCYIPYDLGFDPPV